jgi:hypothetical protein
VVVVAALVATVGATAAPASADTTCYTGGGSSQTFAISRCGTTFTYYFNSGPATGHIESGFVRLGSIICTSH